MSGPLLSLIVVSYNSSEFLMDMLLSAVGSSGRIPMEIIVVDNGSSDGSPELVSAHFPDALVVASSENKGFAWGNNRGASLATGELLLLANSDVVFLGSAVRDMAYYLLEHRDVGALGPKVLNPDGSVQFSGKRMPGVATGALVASGLYHRVPWRGPWEKYYMLPEDYERVQEVDHLTACCLMVRRQVWEEVGGFDEGYFMYFEDIDWCLRARQKGNKLVYLPTASVVHYKSASARKRALGSIRDYHRSARRFYDIHYAPVTPPVVNWLVRLGIKVRMSLQLLLASVGLLDGVKY